ncbi:hypothetical protein E2C01_022324 [Portunus trituberculatus]|uniref:Uncharacterized protein n=1 Tax=Portunus trituberculatus TaxID=210409 RepID=A0A5B7E7C2_PORTR|nr:hypothetical protein [Portunus trituberculatus]
MAPGTDRGVRDGVNCRAICIDGNSVYVDDEKSVVLTTEEVVVVVVGAGVSVVFFTTQTNPAPVLPFLGSTEPSV